MKDRELTFWTTPPNAFLLAKIDEKVIGMVSFQHQDDQTAELNRMSVHTQFRRLGIAKILTEELVEMLRDRGYKRVIASTTINQVGAHRLYENLGFRHNRDISLGSLFSYLSGVYVLEYVYDLA